MKKWYLGVLGLVLSQWVNLGYASYSQSIQPIFTHKCVACHACYDAPCQLNLGSGEGLERGASKDPTYNGGRTTAQPATRLFIDAQTPEGWRNKGFFDVLNAGQPQASLIATMLELGHQRPFVPNSRLPDAVATGIKRQDQCPKPGEFAEFAHKHPHAGMPYGVTGLTDDEYHTVQQWLYNGAQIDWQPWRANDIEKEQISQWEAFLNQEGEREALVSRWLYEHLFIAHIHFQGGDQKHFFRLVRSRTPSGIAVDEIASRRPNDAPGVRVYYRFVPIADAIVHKTHITYVMSPEKLAHVASLFFSEDWQLDQQPGYGVYSRSNPFVTFSAIPAKARYQFMLDDAEYFVRTFIRGPVCRGQVATDVIRDNFWTFFQAPEQDLYVTDADYREQVTPFLAVPGQFDELSSVLSFWSIYKKKRNAYEDLRRNRYQNTQPPDWSHIWTGNDQALLSIFRQHDSASVRKGLLGQIPQTMWLMDYPLLERTYYQLVVNFDVFGNVAHQAQTRLYFDLIRNGSEVNFLRLMPREERQDILSDWYQKSGKIKLWLDYTDIDTRTQSALGIGNDKSVKSFGEALLHRFSKINARPDPINRCQGAHCHREGLTVEAAAVEQSLSRLSARPAAGLKVVHHMPEASMVRVELSDGTREIYSILRHRAHSNVAFMMGESLRYQPGLDTLMIYPEVLSSYPNFIFNMRAKEVPTFVTALEQVKDEAGLRQAVEQWGVRRTHPQFWVYFHDLSEHIRERAPLEAGILDMNRYENL
ncbi:fatty acid cis/trans isomerase [Denitrificimonas sp. JX-1]|uniref:Fatty acid cis/trans isomerase n=1 Tax=Denitrificimonas halotolerans TaxID=3098930 RepID=A0ABU5GQH9_9GAMM|nr:fatty acid cis/trans isomerase [Denitrificimonas sp. JX-1]MDY7219034.1 fatty acid cis/trans isomerase [Denitrificimonas sp. JX-1]